MEWDIPKHYYAATMLNAIVYKMILNFALTAMIVSNPRFEPFVFVRCYHIKFESDRYGSGN